MGIPKNPKPLRLCMSHHPDGKATFIVQAGCDYCKSIDKNIRLQGVLTKRNAEIANLTTALVHSDQSIKQLESDIEVLHGRCNTLREAYNDSTSCPCDDWESVGTNPTTGDKMKQCNICHLISIR